MDREAWHVAVHGVTRSQTWLSDWTELREIIVTFITAKIRTPFPKLGHGEVKTEVADKGMRLDSLPPYQQHFILKDNSHKSNVMVEWTFSDQNGWVSFFRKFLEDILQKKRGEHIRKKYAEFRKHKIQARMQWWESCVIVLRSNLSLYYGKRRKTPKRWSLERK